MLHLLVLAKFTSKSRTWCNLWGHMYERDIDQLHFPLSFPSAALPSGARWTRFWYVTVLWLWWVLARSHEVIRMSYFKKFWSSHSPGLVEAFNQIRPSKLLTKFEWRRVKDCFIELHKRERHISKFFPAEICRNLSVSTADEVVSL